MPPLACLSQGIQLIFIHYVYTLRKYIIIYFSIHNTIYDDGGYDANGLIGSSNQVAKMRILGVGRNIKQVSEVKLGDELELRIDVNHPYSKKNVDNSIYFHNYQVLITCIYNIFLDATNLRAGHLVASSGDGLDSLLLLDWRGCPPEPSTFPILNLTPPNSMTARFKAFRFPSSPVLRFSLMMMFCDQPCKPVSKIIIFFFKLN